MTIDVVGRVYKVCRSSFKPGPIPAASRLGHATQSDTTAAFNPLDGSAFATVPKTSEAPLAPASLKTSRRGTSNMMAGLSSIIATIRHCRRVAGEKMQSLVRGRRDLLLCAPTSGDNGIQVVAPYALRRERNRKR